MLWAAVEFEGSTRIVYLLAIFCLRHSLFDVSHGRENVGAGPLAPLAASAISRMGWLHSRSTLVPAHCGGFSRGADRETKTCRA